MRRDLRRFFEKHKLFFIVLSLVMVVGLFGRHGRLADDQLQDQPTRQERADKVQRERDERAELVLVPVGMDAASVRASGNDQIARATYEFNQEMARRISGQ